MLNEGVHLSTRTVAEWKVCKCGEVFVLQVPTTLALFKEGRRLMKQAGAEFELDVAMHLAECTNKSIEDIVMEIKGKSTNE